MSGHNKWSKIKHKKEASDSKRSKLYSKIIKEISVAVKDNGPNPDANPRLRLAVNAARSGNMPKDTIQRAISKASDKDATHYTETTYEGYGPGGVGIYVECTTDNINRTVSNIRHLFTKHGGNLTTSGSLNFLFDRKGIFKVKNVSVPEDDFMLEVIDAGADDVERDEDGFIVITSMDKFGMMQKKLESMKLEVENAEISRLPKSTTGLSVETGRQAYRLISALEEDDDVQNVFHNLEMTDDILNEAEQV